MVPCFDLLATWLTDPNESSQKGHEIVKLKLRQVGRTDLAHWLSYNIIHEKQIANVQTVAAVEEMEGAKYGDVIHEAALERSEDNNAFVKDSPNYTCLLRKLILISPLALLLVICCICCYRFLYIKLRNAIFGKRCKGKDEESSLQGDSYGSNCPPCCSNQISNQEYYGKDDDKPKYSSPFRFFKNFRRSNFHGEGQCREFSQLKTRLQKTCPAKRKALRLNKQEQKLLKSLTDVEKCLLPATDSDLRVMEAPNHVRKKFSSCETRQKLLIGLRNRLEEVSPEDRKTLTLTESEKKFVRKLTSPERLQLPLSDKDLEILMASPALRREIVLKQLTNKLAAIDPNDKKYLRLEPEERIFLTEVSNEEKIKLGITDVDLQFMSTTSSQRNTMLQKLETSRRDQQVEEIRRKLGAVQFDIARLDLSKVEQSLFVSLCSQELEGLGLTMEHVKFYEASESERKALWSSVPQYRKVETRALQARLEEFPSKLCGPAVTNSEHDLLESLRSEERRKLRITDSDRNVVLATPSEKKIIERRRNVTRLKSKIKEFEETTLTDSERMLMSTLTPSDLSKQDFRSRSEKLLRSGGTNVDVRLQNSGNKPERDARIKLTDGERNLLSSLTAAKTSRTKMSASRIKLLLSTISERDTTLRKKRLEEIADRIGSHETFSVHMSELGLFRMTPSEVSFLMTTRAEQKTTTQELGIDGKSSGSFCRSRGRPSAASNRTSGTMTKVTISCPSKKASDASTQSLCVHGDSSAPKGRGRRSSRVKKCFPGQESNVIGMTTESTPAMARVESGESDFGAAGEFLDDSELSETYDELGMLFSKHMKQQARPCRRKYCLLGRHLKRNQQHDERQCQIRHNCYRGCPNDQRPACSSGHICRDTFDEYSLLRAPANRKRELNYLMHERRKQFLDQPCQPLGPARFAPCSRSG